MWERHVCASRIPLSVRILVSVLGVRGIEAVPRSRMPISDLVYIGFVLC